MGYQRNPNAGLVVPPKPDEGPSVAESFGKDMGELASGAQRYSILGPLAPIGMMAEGLVPSALQALQAPAKALAGGYDLQVDPETSRVDPYSSMIPDAMNTAGWMMGGPGVAPEKGAVLGTGAVKPAFDPLAAAKAAEIAAHQKAMAAEGVVQQPPALDLDLSFGPYHKISSTAERLKDDFAKALFGAKEGTYDLPRDEHVSLHDWLASMTPEEVAAKHKAMMAALAKRSGQAAPGKQHELFHTQEMMPKQLGKKATETPAFKRWFGEGALTDENYKPRPLYHATGVTFDQFNTTGMGELGQHFGTKQQADDIIAGFSGVNRVPTAQRKYRDQAQVHQVWVNLKNPLRLEDRGNFSPSEVMAQLGDMEEFWNNPVVTAGDSSTNADVQKIIEDAGYDGVVYVNRAEGLNRRNTEGPSGYAYDEDFLNDFPEAQDSYIVFHPEQVKSVFNRGTFSPYDPNTLKAQGWTPVYAAGPKDAPKAETHREGRASGGVVNIDTSRLKPFNPNEGASAVQPPAGSPPGQIDTTNLKPWTPDQPVPAPVLAKPTEGGGTLLDAVGQAGMGLIKGIPHAIGFGANVVANPGAALGQALGVRTDALPPPSEALSGALSAVHANPDEFLPQPNSPLERIAEAAGEGAITMLLPGGGQIKGPLSFIRSMMEGGIGGAAAAGAAEIVPEPLKPAAALVGGVLGAGGAHVGIHGAAHTIPRLAGKAADYAAPLFPKAHEGLAAKRYADMFSDPEKAADELEKRAAAVKAGEGVPGSELTTGQSVSDLGAKAAEGAMAREHDAPFLARKAQQNEARIKAIEDVTPEDSAMTVVEAHRAKRQALDEQIAEHERQAQADLAGKKEGITGPGKAESAQGLRGGLQASLRKAQAERRALWKPIDESDASVHAAPVKDAFSKVYDSLPPEAELSAGEAALRRIVGSYGTWLPLKRLSALRVRINDEMRAANTGQPNNQSAFARLKQVREAIETAIDETVSKKIAEDETAVQAGSLAEADALGARLKGQVDDASGAMAGRTGGVGAGEAAVNAAPDTGALGAEGEAKRGPVSAEGVQGVPRASGAGARRETAGDLSQEEFNRRTNEIMDRRASARKELAPLIERSNELDSRGESLSPADHGRALALQAEIERLGKEKSAIEERFSASEQKRKAGGEKPSPMRQELARRFEAAGRPKQEADVLAQITEAGYNTLAKRHGLTPEQVLAKFPLPEAQKADVAPAGSLKQSETYHPVTAFADYGTLKPAGDRPARVEQAIPKIQDIIKAALERDPDPEHVALMIDNERDLYDRGYALAKELGNTEDGIDRMGGIGTMFAKTAETLAPDEAAWRKHTGNVEPPKQLPAPLDPSKPLAPTFYSEAHNAVKNAKITKAPAGQWLSALNGKIKKEELDYLGLEPWLKEQKGSVSKEDVEKYVQANQTNVEEVVYSGDGEGPVDIDGWEWEADEPDRDYLREEARDNDYYREQAKEALADELEVDVDEIADNDQRIYDRAYKMAEEAHWDDPSQSASVSAGDHDFHLERDRDGGVTIYDSTNGDYVYDGGGRLRDIDIRDRIQQYLEEQGSGNGEGTKYHSYSDKGGEDYTEVVLTLPNNPGKQFTSGHDWGDAENVVAHIRFDTRDIGGKRTLFIQEIQSDWHQMGEKQGYRTHDHEAKLEEAQKNYYVARDVLNAAKVKFYQEHSGGAANDQYSFEDVLRRKHGGYTEEYYKARDDLREKVANLPEAAEYNQAYNALNEVERSSRIPDAPFKTSWKDLAIKRMIRWAAEHGHEQVAWTPGDLQNGAMVTHEVKGARYFTKDDQLYISTRGGDDYYGTNPFDRVEVHLSARAEEALAKITDPAEREAAFAKEHAKAKTKAIRKMVGPELAPSVEGGAGETGGVVSAEDKNRSYSTAVVEGIPYLTLNPKGLVRAGGDIQESYGTILPSITQKVVKKFGVELGRMPMKLQGQDINAITVPINDKLRDAALHEGLPLFQRGERGAIQLGADGKPSLISFLKHADKSTGLHELGHHFLQMFKGMAEGKDAPAGLRQDWAVTKNWWNSNAARVARDSKNPNVTAEHVKQVIRDGSTGDKTLDAAIDRGFHEQWARAFERYMRDGVAPTPGLKGVFDQFKEWLTEVYKKVRQLNVKLSPEMKGVFDRMLGAAEEGGAKPTQPRAGAPEGVTPLDKRTAQQYSTAVAASRAEKTNFGAQPVRDILKPGDKAIPDSQVITRAWRPGLQGGEAVRAILKADPGAKKALNDVAAASLADLGELTPAKLAKWRTDHADAIRALNGSSRGLMKKISNVESALDHIANLAALRKDEMDAFDRSALAKVAGLKSDADVTNTIAGLLGNKDSVTKMRELVIAGNGAAKRGLQRAVLEHMLNRLKGTDADSTLSNATFQKYLGKNLPALKEVLDPKQIEMLTRVALELKSIAKNVQVSPGSPTKQYINAAKKYHTDEPSILQNIALSIGTGGGAGLLGFLVHPLVGVAGAIGGPVFQMLRATGLHSVEQLVIEAMLHPEVGLRLLKKAPKRKGTGSEYSLGKALMRIGAFGAITSSKYASGGRVGMADGGSSHPTQTPEDTQWLLDQMAKRKAEREAKEAHEYDNWNGRPRSENVEDRRNEVYQPPNPYLDWQNYLPSLSTFTRGIGEIFRPHLTDAQQSEQFQKYWANSEPHPLDPGLLARLEGAPPQPSWMSNHSPSDIENWNAYQTRKMLDEGKAYDAQHGTSAPAGTYQFAGTGQAATPTAADLIKQFEGFRPTPYDDGGTLRIGYGSDTWTDDQGKSHKVTLTTPAITEEAANRDLQRRIPEFQKKGIIPHVGKEAWDKLPPATQAAVTSLAYNYGSIAHLPSLKKAIQTGDPAQVSRAIANRSNDNGGLLAQRRAQEASIAATGTTARAPSPAGADLQTELARRYGQGNVYPQLQVPQTAGLAPPTKVTTVPINPATGMPVVPSIQEAANRAAAEKRRTTFDPYMTGKGLLPVSGVPASVIPGTQVASAPPTPIPGQKTPGPSVSLAPGGLTGGMLQRMPATGPGTPFANPTGATKVAGGGRYGQEAMAGRPASVPPPATAAGGLTAGLNAGLKQPPSTTVYYPPGNYGYNTQTGAYEIKKPGQMYTPVHVGAPGTVIAPKVQPKVVPVQQPVRVAATPPLPRPRPQVAPVAAPGLVPQLAYTEPPVQTPAVAAMPSGVRTATNGMQYAWSIKPDGSYGWERVGSHQNNGMFGGPLTIGGLIDAHQQIKGVNSNPFLRALVPSTQGTLQERNAGLVGPAAQGGSSGLTGAATSYQLSPEEIARRMPVITPKQSMV